MATQADVAAYNARRNFLRERGIEIPDLYGDDILDDDSDPSGNRRYWRRIDAEAQANRAYEEETQRQVEALERWTR